jgi:sec-independent protein translocase protein TatA
MGTFGIWHWLGLAFIVLLLFGSQKIPGAMGDLAKGIRSFRNSLRDDAPKDPPAKS